MNDNRENNFNVNSEIDWAGLSSLAHMGDGVSFNTLLMMATNNANSLPAADLIINVIRATSKFIDASALEYSAIHNNENIVPSAQIITCLNQLAEAFNNLENFNRKMKVPLEQHTALSEIDHLCRTRTTARLNMLHKSNDRFFKIYREQQNNLLPLIEPEQDASKKPS